MSELADETDSKSVVRKDVWVRAPPAVLNTDSKSLNEEKLRDFFGFLNNIDTILYKRCKKNREHFACGFFCIEGSFFLHDRLLTKIDSFRETLCFQAISAVYALESNFFRNSFLQKMNRIVFWIAYLLIQFAFAF